MRKYIPIVVCILIIILFIVRAENYREEVNLLENEINQMNNKEKIYFEAGDIAEDFINDYFIYNKKPNKDKVKKYLIEEKLNELSFTGGEEYDKSLADVHSDVKNLSIYYGDSNENKQKVLGIFKNEITVSNVESVNDTFIDLDMEKINGSWKIVDFQFYSM